jgi:hypothetical protein
LDGDLLTALVFLVIFATTLWLGVDASRRDWSSSTFARSAGVWVFGSLAMWIVIFPLYLLTRARAPLKNQ